MSKIFIIGLPRTGTTSVSVFFLELGFNVAHTAYTEQTFVLADVVSDTPVYCDYPFLDKAFPASKFIYLERDVEAWSYSMRALLAKVSKNIGDKKRGYHPLLERCYHEVFSIEDLEIDIDRGLGHLKRCFLSHRACVNAYFSKRQSDLLVINVSQENASQKICDFVGRENNGKAIPRLNEGGRIFEWEKIKHPLKVGSHERNARGRKYFDIARLRR